MAEVEWLAEDGEGDDAEAAVLAQGVVRRFDAYRGAVADTGAIEAAQMLELPEDPRILSYLVAVAMVLDLSRPPAAARGGDHDRPAAARGGAAARARPSSCASSPRCPPSTSPAPRAA